jgi:hypothetical protein
MRKARIRVSIRDLIIALAIVGLMLGHLTHSSRRRPGLTRVTIRVFNKTSEPIGSLRYEWDTVAQHLESHHVNSGTVRIAPGSLKSFRIDLPGPVDFSLSCTTPGGQMASGLVRIDVGGDHPDSVDFDVRPYGVAVRGPSGAGR